MPNSAPIFKLGGKGGKAYVAHPAKISELQKKRRGKDNRPSAHQRGYNHKWRRERKRFLAKNPICRICEDEGYVKSASVVDHIVPHRGDQKLFWDKSNWQPLCQRCHNAKTARGA